ncbi:hypothetical protein [Nonomuraea sp. SBT364]|uniref:hypothetical protein n=1 Tax=Nonomuraea sp. SBT364 TaxID=1580530 RepID=UPI0012E2816E|nr:hypothetical protein [Nonomuraea sp. SBT364]
MSRERRWPSRRNALAATGALPVRAAATAVVDPSARSKAGSFTARGAHQQWQLARVG